VDLAAWQAGRKGAWFSEDLAALPLAEQPAAAVFTIQDMPLVNRKGGKIAPTLLGGYVFLQFGEVTPALLQRHVQTIGACFIRSALMSFVDYPNNRVLNWDRISSRIPMDVSGIIGACNQAGLPVFLEINYSDVVPGPPGSGVDALQKADNITATIEYIRSLEAQGLHIAGVTFGDEIGDDAGFGNRKPTMYNSNLVDRFTAYALAIKSAFPTMKVYAFDSYIAATRGQVSDYWDLLQEIRQAEVRENAILLDGFIFRESYTYMNDQGQVLDSQLILDDTESLYRDASVQRYDVDGIKHKDPDRDYLHQVLRQTRQIFERDLDIGISEYLPAGPVQINESDTSPYADMDFILHYSDVVGIYAELGLDTVSTWMFANTNDQAKCYIDKNGRQGPNYPVHAQLAQYFRGEVLQVERPMDYNKLKVKVYAARNENGYFIMILNKDVKNEAVVRLSLAGQLDLTLRLPQRSYTSLVIGEEGITVSGIGN
jgi:hypothetical protein